jgi:hypothetical protein
MEKKKCCICGKEFTGFGNNPYGALDGNYNVIEWEENDRCCDKCDSEYVIWGRLYLYNKAKNRRK